MPGDALLFLVLMIVVFVLAAWAGWSVAARRERKPPILPDRVWLCEACKSFNDPTHATCYRCHRPRPIDAREVVPDPEFHIDQQLGRTKGSTNLGASSPWLASEEPLRDAWLTERAGATKLAAPPPDDPSPTTDDPGATTGPG